MKTSIAVFLTALTALPAPASAQTPTVTAHDAAPLSFRVTYDPALADSYTGRVYVITTTNTRREARFGPSWFGPEPFFAVDVVDWAPNTPLAIDDAAIAFPTPLSELPADTYAVQTVMRLNRDTSLIGRGPGNAYSVNRSLDLDARQTGIVELRIDRTVPTRALPKHDRVRWIELRSESLSAFHGRDVMMRAAVILPRGYDDGDRAYPAYYWIGGFGSDHTRAPRMMRLWDGLPNADRIVRVVLDPQCYGGHHAFADSENNGPRGRALVEEFIPHLESTFRLDGAPDARFASGYSSGGWSSLWLQITYPDFFGGVFSIAPDPVDFRDFQKIDLYAAAANMYVDATGERRPLARRGEQVMLWYRDFARMEVVMGEGGQLRSFEWVFSPRGADGRPVPLYDRETGVVDSAVAESWKRYDIRLILEDNWPTLAPRLAGKIHVFMGDLDTFYLDGATKLLKQSHDRLGSDADIRIIPGADHGSVLTPQLREEIDEMLLETYDGAAES